MVTTNTVLPKVLHMEVKRISGVRFPGAAVFRVAVFLQTHALVLYNTVKERWRRENEERKIV